MPPKIVFMDLEGTLFQKNRRLDNGLVAPSAWTVLAERIGKECLEEEEETKKRWILGEYPGYIEWMRDTIRIHQKYRLNKSLFDEVINEVQFMPMAKETVNTFRNNGVITVIISGGFKALADRAQKELKIDHALSACEYFFNEESGEIDHFNLLPSDHGGKVSFVKLIAKEHGVSLKDCVFVGDGKNDVTVAMTVGFSIAFNAQPELKKVASFSIDQRTGHEDFSAVLNTIHENFTSG